MKNQGIIIEPTESGKNITSPKVTAPQLDTSFSSTGQFVKGMSELAISYQRLRDIQAKTAGFNADAVIDDKLSNFLLSMQTDKEFFKDPNKIGVLEEEVNNIVSNYKKLSQDQGYDNDYTNAFIARIEGKLQNAKNNFYTNYSNYQEKVTLDNYIKGQEMAQQNNERYMALGEYSSAINGVQQTITNMTEAAENGIIDKSKLPTGIKAVWNGSIKAFGMSLVNKPNAQALLDRYYNMSISEFFEEFKTLNTKIEGEDFTLGSDEYEAFRVGIGRAYSELRRQGNTTSEMSLVDKLKRERDIDTKPIETYFKEMNFSANHVITEEDILAANNLHYRSNYKSLNEMRKKGIPIIWEEKGLTDNKLFNSDAPAEQLIKSKLILKNQLAGNSNKEVQGDYLDFTNRDSVVPTGSAMIDLYLTNSEFSKSYDFLFSSENREILEKTKKIKIPEHRLKVFSQELNILKENALNGDYKSQVLVEDIEKLEKAAVLIPLLNEKGMIVDKDWAKDVDIEESWVEGKLFTDYSTEQQKKLLDYKIEELGDREYFDFLKRGYNNPTDYEIEKDLSTVKNEIFKDKVNVDFGNNGTVILPNNVNGQATVDATKKFFETAIKNKELIDPVTNKPIGSISSLRVVVPLGESTLGVTYNGNKVLYKGKLLKIPVITNEEE